MFLTQLNNNGFFLWVFLIILLSFSFLSQRLLLDAQNCSGESALFRAMFIGRASMSALLLDEGAASFSMARVQEDMNKRVRKQLNYYFLKKVLFLQFFKKKFAFCSAFEIKLNKNRRVRNGNNYFSGKKSFPFLVKVSFKKQFSVQWFFWVFFKN